ncbi:glycoside hydrolase family 13 protein [Planomonospora sp. ID91781]|uniref:glycoside hydrolase family 13 protein n=1 Tax=Planomonospora sp. ID91781 TaxID=2738135 RepID=UPI0018C3B087|nr:glycoside hydrolase family 13 protein [Planomonospora sp. ID91781]MBG0823242.1 glycoside hydrolase family 13 protein [Planomonospora sp. ID91781]
MSGSAIPGTPPAPATSAGTVPQRGTERGAWWRGAAIYQVYLRSFADGNGDGIGDLAGLRARLPYLAELGADAIWLNPWYPSPMADGGYDVADYRDIDPVFGTLAEAEKLIEEAHSLGIRTIIDIVPNHGSVEQEWFVRALAAGPGSPERERFWFRDGRGDLPPNDWRSIFGGPAWTRVADGQWYLHLFDPGQPDFNWDAPEVVAEFHDVLRFWLDRGVDGIRIDSAALIVKDFGSPTGADGDLDGVHEIYRGWRRITDSYEDRILIGEVWLPDQERFARYLRPDEMHTAFNFDFLGRAWDARELRASIELTLATHVPIGAPPTWVLSNHDVPRPVTRYGRRVTSFSHADRRDGAPSDAVLGERRARAAALLALALPGSAYVYQGEELGLPEVDDIPGELRQDPIWTRSGRTVPGRDGCRVPLPWSGQEPPFGFGTGEPWLPQPASWKDLTAEAQAADPGSMLNLYRRSLRIRRAELGDGVLRWLEAGEDVLAFTRESGLACVVNLGPDPVRLPPHGTVLLASGPLDGDRLPADTAVWLRTG